MEMQRSPKAKIGRSSRLPGTSYLKYSEVLRCVHGNFKSRGNSSASLNYDTVVQDRIRGLSLYVVVV